MKPEDQLRPGDPNVVLVETRRSLMGVPIGAAAVVVLFAAVLAAGLFGQRALPAAASTSAVPTAPETRIPVPSATPTLRPSQTPPPEPTATLPPGVIYSGPAGAAAWSPDSMEIAITVVSEGTTPYVLVMTDGGSQIDRIDADEFVWTSSDTYVALYDQGTPTGEGFLALAGQIWGNTTQQIEGTYESVLAGSGGAVALKLTETGGNHYRIWGPNGLSEPRDGVPIAFSPDGSMLAVVHYPTACCAGAPSPAPTRASGPPTLDMVSVDTGKSLATNANVEWAYSAYLAFSPDSRYIAFLMRTKDAQPLGRLGVMEIATKKLWTIDESSAGEYEFGAPFWLDSDRVAVMGPSSPLPAGLPVSVDFEPFDDTSIVASLDGREATIAPNTSQIFVETRDGLGETYDLPATAEDALWAPDGSKIAVFCGNISKYPYVQEVAIIWP